MAIETCGPMQESTIPTSPAQQHREAISILNDKHREHLELHGDALEASYQERIAALQAGIDERVGLLHARVVQHNLAEVAGRYKQAEKLVPPAASPRKMLAYRLSQFDSLHVVSDFDITMTYEETNTERHYLMPNVPGSEHLEEFLMQYGRGEFIRGFVTHIQDHLREEPDLFREGGRHAVEWRQGAIEYFTDLLARNVERTILSANFKPFIEGALIGTPLSDDIDLRIVAITSDDISSTDKGTAIQLLAAGSPRNAVVYIGDGASDMKIVEAYRNHAIAGIFALEGCEFDKQLSAQDIPHFTYNTFDDIRVELERAEGMAQQLRQQAA